jgi:hypothetical protein
LEVIMLTIRTLNSVYQLVDTPTGRQLVKLAVPGIGRKIVCSDVSFSPISVGAPLVVLGTQPDTGRSGYRVTTSTVVHLSATDVSSPVACQTFREGWMIDY